MTEQTIDLQALREKTTGSDFSREMIGYTAQRLMALEIETLTGATPGARSADQLSLTNAPAIGTVTRRVAGTVELCIPKLRKES